MMALAAGGLALAACSGGFAAPSEAGVCYSIFPDEDPRAAPQVNVVARDQARLEDCAARLEELRVRFLRVGGSREEIIGAYQGRFIFVDRRGVYTGSKLEGGVRYATLARTGDGRLAIPGAIVRDETGRPVAVAGGTAEATPGN